MSDIPHSKLHGFGYLFLSLGFGYQAVKAFGLMKDGVPARADLFAGTRGTAGLRGLNGPESDAMKSAGGIIEKATTRTVGNIDERAKFIAERIRKDSLKPIVRERALAVLTRKCETRGGGKRWCVEPKNYEAEIRALYSAVQDANSDVALRYVRDHIAVDQFHAADKLMRLKGGDCFVKGTLLLKDDHTLVPVEDVRTGDRIWGRDRWSTVENTWEKGALPTWRVSLNNGSSMRLTPDHKVYVARCDRHANRTERSQPCSCPIEDRTVERVLVRDLNVGDVLLRPARIPFGTSTPDARRAYIEGLYLSDGWSEPGRFSISGKDGCPKEGQKREVEAICRELSIETRWYEKSIRILDGEWAARLSTMGTHAPEKHALSIDLAAEAAGALLRGIMADSGANSAGNGRTFTTTSRALFLQTRMLLKMFGVTCGERYIVDHGGLGTNPIWRLQTWDQNRSDEKREKLLRVAAIDEDEISLPVFDLATDDHYVYLPEADWTVSNCDDGTILLGAMLRSVGYPTKMRVIQDTSSPTWSHIYLLVGLPPTNPNKWVPLDWSVYPFKAPGWEAPGASQVALSGKPAGMVTKLRDFEV